ncbi:hypothetical protein A9K55_003969 [Cordyceps militaris]|uniref:Uncharacterized protein n=1 Tax=Cordyceps militaris TaxID=73501 RepID=A0A2H4SL34_CORMI|nr:hypothetical protein A9K55_003969 [Cordyceps militaris]
MSSLVAGAISRVTSSTPGVETTSITHFVSFFLVPFRLCGRRDIPLPGKFDVDPKSTAAAVTAHVHSNFPQVTCHLIISKTIESFRNARYSTPWPGLRDY